MGVCIGVGTSVGVCGGVGKDVGTGVGEAMLLVRFTVKIILPLADDRFCTQILESPFEEQTLPFWSVMLMKIAPEGPPDL